MKSAPSTIMLTLTLAGLLGGADKDDDFQRVKDEVVVGAEQDDDFQKVKDESSQIKEKPEQSIVPAQNGAVSLELRPQKWLELIAAWEQYDHDLCEDSQVIKVLESIPADVLAQMVVHQVNRKNEIILDPHNIPTENCGDLRALQTANPELVYDEGDSKKFHHQRRGWIPKDPSDPKGIKRLEKSNETLHPIFSMPRRVWDKILSTNLFGSVDSFEKHKLLMLHPDEILRGKKGDYDAFKKIADDTLTVDFPTLQHICEPKSQVTFDGMPQFLIMAKHNRTVEKSFEVPTIEKQGIEDKGGRQEKTTFSLQTLYCPGDSVEFAVKNDPQNDEDQDIMPMPFATWEPVEGRDSQLYFAQNKNGDVCYIVMEEDQLVAQVKTSGSNQRMEKMPIGFDSPLRQHIMAGVRPKDPKKEDHAKYHRYFEPQLLCKDPANQRSEVLAYTSVTFPEDQGQGFKQKFAVHFHDLKADREIVKFEGAQTVLFARKSQDSDITRLLLLADPYLNLETESESKWFEQIHSDKWPEKYPQAKTFDLNLVAPDYEQIIDLDLDMRYSDFVRNFQQIDSQEERDGWQYINLPIAHQMINPCETFEFTLGRVIQLEANGKSAFVVTLIDSFYFQYDDDFYATRRFNWGRAQDVLDNEKLRNARPIPSQDSKPFSSILCSYTKRNGGIETQVVIKVDEQDFDEDEEWFDGEPTDFAARKQESFKGLSGKLLSRMCYAWDYQKGYIGCGLGCQVNFFPPDCNALHMLYLAQMKSGVADELINQQSCNVWKTVVSHPLVCHINKFIPNHLYLYHSNERDLSGQDAKTSLIEFRYCQEVLAITAPQRYKQWYRPRINILHNTGQIFIATALELKDPYLKDSVIDLNNWLLRRCECPDLEYNYEDIDLNMLASKGRKLEQSIEYGPEIRNDGIFESLMMKSKPPVVDLVALARGDKNFALSTSDMYQSPNAGVTKQTQINNWWFLDGKKGSLLTADLQKQEIQVRFAESEMVVMTEVKPAISDYGFFYAERDVETQLEYIVYQEFARAVRYRVCAMQEGDLMGIQICSESVHHSDKDYKKAGLIPPGQYKAGEIREQGVMDIRDQDEFELYLFDRTMNLTKMLFDTNKKMLINPQRTKIRIEALSRLAKDWNQNQGLCLSERALVFGQNVFPNTEEGEVFRLDSSQLLNNYLGKIQEFEVLPVAGGNTVLCNAPDLCQNVMRHIQMNDPGRRGLSFAHVAFLRNLASCHQVAPDTFLCQMKRSDTSHYWTVMKINGQLAKVPQDLQSQLNIEENPRPATSLLIQGGLTQIITGKEDDDATKVIRINSKLEVLHANQYKYEVIQNFYGNLARVSLEYIDEDGGDENKKAYKCHLSCQEKQPDTQFLHVLFQMPQRGIKAKVRPEMIYLGNCVVIKEPFENRQRERHEQMIHTSSIGSFKISQGKEALKSGQITLQAINPHTVLRQLRYDQITQNDDYNRFYNQFQVTAGGLNNIYEVVNKRENKTLNMRLQELHIGEGTDQKEYFDPNRFVELGLSISKSAEYVNWESKTEQKVKYLDSCEFNNVVRFQQRKVEPLDETRAVQMRPLIGLYRKFCRTDIEQLQNLRNALRERRPVLLDINLAYAEFYGTGLSLNEMQKEIPLYNQALQTITCREFAEDDVRLLKLARRITLKHFKYDPYVKKNPWDGYRRDYATVSHLSENMFEGPKRDILLKIGRHCPKFTLFSELASKYSFSDMVSNMSNTVAEEFKHCFQPTFRSSLITQMEVYDESTILEVDDCHITPEHFMSKDGKRDSKTIPYEVLCFDTRWLKVKEAYPNDSEFLLLLRKFVELPNHCYESPLIQYLLDQQWPIIKGQIQKHEFSDFLWYTGTQIIYFKFALKSRDRDEPAHVWKIVGMTVLCLLTLFFWIKQVINRRKINEITGAQLMQKLSNKPIEMIGFVLVFFLLFITGCQIKFIPLQSLRVMAAFATCITLTTLISWMKLFEQTSFYVLLIQTTLKDIKYFILLLIIALLMFGVPVLILDMNSAEDAGLIDDNFNFWLLDLMFNQYMLALGEFGMDNFQGHPQQILIYCFFFAATFISQLTMLNMLIAIMGDSFNKVFENKVIHGIKIKLEFIKEYEPFIWRRGQPKYYKDYLFVGRQAVEQDDEGEDDEWEGTVRRLTRTMHRATEAVKKTVEAKFEKIQSICDENNRKETMQGRKLKAHYDSAIKKQSDEVKSYKEKFDDVTERLDNKLESRYEHLMKLIQERIQ